MSERIRCRVAGVLYHQGAQTRLNRLRHGDRLRMVREPGNPHDRNAVALHHRDQMLGYLPKEVAAKVAARIDCVDDLVAEVDGWPPNIIVRERPR